jgi:hypothetical protein
MVADRRPLEKACDTPQITRNNREQTGSEKSAVLLSPWQLLVKLLSLGEQTGYN